MSVILQHVRVDEGRVIAAIDVPSEIAAELQAEVQSDTMLVVTGPSQCVLLEVQLPCAVDPEGSTCKLKRVLSRWVLEVAG